MKKNEERKNSNLTALSDDITDSLGQYAKDRTASDSTQI